ncbi:hypothetical protein K488DRAFT_83808 [Vararia minispora EC-137]|uniref:Uncharacterized protein n=1 Tax=Vararia minispora EC-137 TaxID=1314806 RepID=A0ACB8QSN3_9AGAM|nr:hypothetical protein K488DRAFT_83808 [Vararia minispora EC-137]
MPLPYSPPVQPTYSATTVDGHLDNAERGDPWLNNGNVVIVRHTEFGDRAWRVDEGAVCEGSEYLKNILSPSGTNRPLLSDTIQSCKVIRVHDEFATADRIEEVLQLLYGKLALPTNNLNDADSCEELLEFLELTAMFGAWSHYFTALRPFFAEYRDRLSAFSVWDGMRDLPSPRNSAIHMLNTTYAAQRLLECYAAEFATEGDQEIHMAMQVMKSGCRLDLSLFIPDDELRRVPEPDPSAAPASQSPDVLSLVDRHQCRGLRDLHHIHAVRLRCALASFEELNSPPKNHIRCCGEAVNRLFVRLSTVWSRRKGTRTPGTLFLDLVRGLHTDSGRFDVCDYCLNDLDAVLQQAYNEWWMQLSPYIRGLKKFDAQ